MASVPGLIDYEDASDSSSSLSFRSVMDSLEWRKILVLEESRDLANAFARMLVDFTRDLASMIKGGLNIHSAKASALMRKLIEYIQTSEQRYDDLCECEAAAALGASGASRNTQEEGKSRGAMATDQQARFTAQEVMSEYLRIMREEYEAVLEERGVECESGDELQELKGSWFYVIAEELPRAALQDTNVQVRRVLIFRMNNDEADIRSGMAFH